MTAKVIPGDEEAQRDAVDAAVRSWIGTPFHDCAQVKGAGVDCGMLLRAVYTEAGTVENFDISPYSAQHFLHRNDEHYLGYVLQFTHEIPLERVRHGDIVLYRIGNCFAHGAVVIRPGWPNIVHAHAASRVVRRAQGNAIHLGIPIRDVKYFTLWGE